MPAGGAVRGKWCSEGPHSHTQAGVPGTFRAWNEEGTAHISGSGHTPPHHDPPPCGGHDVALQHIHSQVAKGITLINGMPPVLEGDTGCWACPCHKGKKFDFVITKNPYEVYIEGRSVAVQTNCNMVTSGSMHGGNGIITCGGSGDVFIGVHKVSPESHG